MIRPTPAVSMAFLLAFDGLAGCPVAPEQLRRVQLDDRAGRVEG